MNPRITSIENLIARDPGHRNVFALMLADQLRLAAQSLRLARRVGIVSGFFVPEAGAGETDGPPGAKVVGDALAQLGIEIDHITDERNAPLFRAIGIEPLVEPEDYLEKASPTHLLAIERVGRARDGRYRNMHGVDVTDTNPPLDELFIEGMRRGLTTIGIGDGGNEIGMGRVFSDALATTDHGADIACIVPTDFCIAAGVSNWGGYGLAGALSVLSERDLLPSAEDAARTIEKIVEAGGVDGVTHRREATVDGLEPAESVRMLEGVRRQIAPSPFLRGEPLRVGILGFGETGRAAARLLANKGHDVLVSELGGVSLDGRIQLAGVETGAHSIEFLGGCDVVVASPGVRADAPIRDALHRQGVPVVSALEMAYQHCDRELIAVTGTIGKRSTVEYIQRLFQKCGTHIDVGGNRGEPLASLMLDEKSDGPIALAVSSFQLETVVHFRAHIAIVLNVAEAHLDRHRTIAEYVRIKSRVFMNHRADDVLILNYDDERVRALARKHHGRTLFVSKTQAVDRGAWLDGDAVRLNVDGMVERAGTLAPCFAENVLSAALVARLWGVSPGRLATAFAELQECEGLNG